MTAYIESDGLRLRRKVRALVLNENDEVLLVRPHGYRDGEWTLAGGGVEEGESPVEAMRRELAEELGVGLEAELSELPVKLTVELMAPFGRENAVFSVTLDAGYPSLPPIIDPAENGPMCNESVSLKILGDDWSRSCK